MGGREGRRRWYGGTFLHAHRPHPLPGPPTWSSPGLGGKWLRAHRDPQDPNREPMAVGGAATAAAVAIGQTSPVPSGCLGSPSADGLWLGGASPRTAAPPDGSACGWPAGQGSCRARCRLAQDVVSPRGPESRVLHHVDVQVCCSG